MGTIMRLGLYIGKAFTARKASVFDTVVLDKDSQVPHAALDVLPSFLAAAFISGAYYDGNRIITLSDRFLGTLYVLEGYVESDPAPAIQRPALFRVKRAIAGISIAEIVEAITRKVKELQDLRDELGKNPEELEKKKIASLKDNILAFEIRHSPIKSMDDFDDFLREAKVVLGDSRINIVVNTLVFTMINKWGVTTLPFIYNYIVNSLSSGELTINAAGIEQNFRIPWMLITDSVPISALTHIDYIGVISALSQKLGRRIR
jgi:hypothetical protein